MKGKSIIMHFLKKLKPAMVFLIICGFITAVLISNLFFASKNTTALATASHSSTENTSGSIFLQKTTFANNILHWTQTEFSYRSNGIDPENGQPLLGDIWVSVGNDGIPTLIHTRYTSTSRALVQEIIQTPDTITILFGKGYSHSGCQVLHEQSSQKELLSALPSFTKSSILSSAKFFNGSVQNHALPTTQPLIGITPAGTYSSGMKPQQWQRNSTYMNGQTDNQTLTINTDGRVLMQEVKLLDNTGKVLQDNWHTYGNLFVYKTTDVPTTMYANVIQGGCNA